MYSANMRSVKLLALLSLLLTIVAGCDSSGNEEPDATIHGVYVVNQGVFPAGPGSVTVYDPETKATSSMTIEGATAQGAALQGKMLFVAANSGNRIDIFNVDTKQRTGQIASNLLISPRYLAFSGPTTAYVTNLYGAVGSFAGGVVSVLDLTTGTVVKNIPVGENPEGITVAGDHVFVANHGFGADSTVTVISASSNTVIKTLDVCQGPRTLLVDRQDDVWVFCTGRTLYDEDYNEIGKTNGAVDVISSTTLERTGQIAIVGQFGAAAFGQDAVYNDDNQEIFVVVNESGIMRIDTQTNLPSALAVSSAAGPISSVAYDKVRGRLYVGRVPAYDAPGTVTIHNRSGAQTGSFTAGIIPTYIVVNDGE